ncbi:anti-sigma B factor RsbW [soil metagenome]
MKSGDQIQLQFPARRAYLSVVRVLVTSLVDDARDLDAAKIDDLRLAVSEACANAIDAYTGGGREAEQVVVRVSIGADRIEVEVLDHAGGFDPGELRPHPPVTKPARLEFERGLGIPLMKVLADEVEIRPADDGTAVRLVLFTGGRR